MKKITLTLLFTFKLILFSFSSTNPNIINFDRYNYKAGNKNWSITEDDKGTLYFGNDLGLLEFDGIEWILHRTPKNDLIRSIYAQSYNEIFTGGYEDFGVWKRNPDGTLTYNSLSKNLSPKQLHNSDIWRIIEKDGNIYFQSFGNIYIYNFKEIKVLPPKKNILLLNKVYNELWIQEMGGALYKVHEDRYEKIKGSDFFSESEVKSILPTDNNEYIITTNSMGVFIYDGKDFKAWNQSEILKKSNINCGIRSKSGNYYFGSIIDGIFELNPSGEIVNHLNSNSYLNNNTVLALYEDQSNIIWSGLDRGLSCVFYIEGANCFIDHYGKIGAVYSAALFDNKLFIGTNQGTYYIDIKDLNNTNSINKFKFIPETKGQVWILKEIRGVLYCGNNQGVYTIDKDLNISYPYPLHTGVFDILEVNDKKLLLGTYIGATLVDIGSHNLSRVNDLSEPINLVKKDHLDNIWLQHMNKGIYKGKYNPDYTNLYINEYIGSQDNNTIPYQLKTFKIGGRIAFLGDNSFYTYDDINGKIVEEPSLNKAFKGITDLKKVVNITPESFWIIGNNLIYKVDYKSQNSFITSILNINYQNFSLVDNYENIVNLNDSISLVCLDKGFLICANNTQFKDISLSKPYIKSILASDVDGNKTYVNQNQKDIKRSYNTISFKFGADGLFRDNINFQYQLEGLSDKWITIINDNKIVFERLNKGEYTLRVRTINQYGKTSEVTSFHFEVLPNWYESSLAIILYVIFTCLTFLGIYRYSLYRNYKKHRKRLHIIEAKRLNIMNASLKQEIEEKNAELLTQTSSIIQRNELIQKIKNEIEDFIQKQNNKSTQPLYQKISAILNSNLDSEDDWKMFLIKFEQKHTNFFKNLKEDYPQLTPNDLKLCACLKLNLNSKDIASLMNISVRAIENNRSRLRKKLNIPANLHLSDFFMKRE